MRVNKHLRLRLFRPKYHFSFEKKPTSIRGHAKFLLSRIQNIVHLSISGSESTPCQQYTTQNYFSQQNPISNSRAQAES